MTVNKMIRDLNFYRGQKLFEFNGKKPEIYIFDIIDIINDQKAEIEKLWICVDELKKEVGRHERNYDPSDETQKIIKKIMGKDGTKKARGKIKAEAYKEFAEEVNKELFGEEYQFDKVNRRAVERVLNELISRE